MTDASQYNAAGSMAGYLFQCRVALFQGMEMVKKKPNGSISIERFDDVAFENNDIAECLIQAKHHINAGSLADKSTDVWKTIRIWAEKTLSTPLFPYETKLVLLTTSTAPVGSAMEKLRPTTDSATRKIACEQLVEIAKTSANEQTAAGRSSFLKLNSASQQALVSAIEVADNAPNLIDMREEIEGQLAFSAPDHVELITNYLEGWWFSIVAKSLVESDSTSIPVQHIQRKVYEIAGKIQQNELMILEPNAAGLQTYSEEDESRIFVKQMRLINISDSAVQRGVSDFYRAKTQRAQWAREELLLDGETAKYDLKLRDQWERKREQELDETPPENEQIKEQIGKRIFYWAGRNQIPLRNIVETWITAGSFHSLAERLDVGWHPDFKERIEGEE